MSIAVRGVVGCPGFGEGLRNAGNRDIGGGVQRLHFRARDDGAAGIAEAPEDSAAGPWARPPAASLDSHVKLLI